MTLSAGIGIYDAGYPISVSAKEVAQLEDSSKKRPGKGSVTVFSDGTKHEEKRIEDNKKIKIDDGSYSWREFEEEVIGEKYKQIEDFFDNSDERGKAFLYNLLELIRYRHERINFARYVYILARLEPSSEASQEQKALYSRFSKNMYQWIKEEKACRQLKTAMNLYAYITRESEEGVEDGRK